MVGVLYLAGQLVGPVVGLEAFRYRVAVDRWARATVLDAVMAPAHVDLLEDPRHQDLVSVALGRSDWAGPPGGFVEGVAEQWPRRIAAAGAIVLVASWSVPLALLLPIVGILGLGAWRRSFYSFVVGPEADVEGLRAAAYTLGLAIESEHSRETRLFEMRPWLIARHEALWLRTMRPVWRHRRHSSLLVAAAIGANAVVRLVALGVLGRAAVRGEVSARTVAVVAPSILQASQIAGIVGGAELGMQRCLATVGAILALAPASRPADEAGVAVAAPRSVIRFDDVSFAYNEGATVLSHLNLDIAVGRSLAIVGLNGAGKTTLVKLLAGLHEPTSGRITVDDVDRRTIDAIGWQRQVAAIFQDFGRYPLSARDNIGWGSPDHLHDEDGIRESARVAGALALIESLPRGFDTTMDRRFVDGADASGGEWQRIAIARAMFAVRHGASVLVLDEPTAQLDARAEADIYERFLDLTRGVTAVIVSHRFSTIRRADCIVVMDAGGIVERGTHAELLAFGGRYATMFRAQADALVDGASDADD